MVQRSTSGTNFRASTALAEKFEELSNQLKTAGWEYRPIVIYQGNDKPSSRFGAFVRDIPNPLVMTKGFVNQNKSSVNIFSNDTVTKKNERLTKTEKSSNNAGSNGIETMGVNSPYGYPIREVDPATCKSVSSIVSIGDIPSVGRMRDDRSSLCIAIDTEFITFDGEREILTWQFAFISSDPSQIHEVVVFSLAGDRLPLGLVLSWLLTHYRLCRLPFVTCSDNGYYYRDTRRWPVPCVNPNSKGKGKTVRKVLFPSFESALENCSDDSYLEKLKLAGPAHKLDSKVDGDVGYINDFGDYDCVWRKCIRLNLLLKVKRMKSLILIRILILRLKSDFINRIRLSILALTEKVSAIFMPVLRRKHEYL